MGAGALLHSLLDVLIVGVQKLPELLWHVLPSLVTVGFGGWLLNKFFVRKANVANLVDRSCNQLNELKNLSAKYWTTGFVKSKSTEIGEQEAKMKAGVDQVAALLSVIKEKYGHVPVALEEQVMHLADLCTGGDFESETRKPDKMRFMRIASAINRLTVGFQKLKL